MTIGTKILLLAMKLPRGEISERNLIIRLRELIGPEPPKKKLSIHSKGAA